MSASNHKKCIKLLIVRPKKKMTSNCLSYVSGHQSNITRKEAGFGIYLINALQSLVSINFSLISQALKMHFQKKNVQQDDHVP